MATGPRSLQAQHRLDQLFLAQTLTRAAAYLALQSVETTSHKGVGNQPVAEEFARTEARSCLNATVMNAVSRSRLVLCLPRGFGWHDDLPRSALVSDCNVIRGFHRCLSILVRTISLIGAMEQRPSQLFHPLPLMMRRTRLLQSNLVGRDPVLDLAEGGPGQHPLRHEVVDRPVGTARNDRLSKPPTQTVQVLG